MVELHLVKGSLCILQLLAQVFVGEFFYFFNLHSLSVFVVITSYNKFSLNGELLSCEAKSLLSDIKRYSLYFKEDTARCNRCNPSCGITLSLTHTHISRLTRNRFVREDTDPNLTLTVHVTVHGHTSGFYLTAVNPFCLKCLDTKRTKSQLCTTVSVAFIATSILWSSIFYSFRL